MVKISRNIVTTQLQLFLLAASLLFIFKIFFGSSDSVYLRIILDLLIAASIFFLLIALIRFENSRTTAPLSLIMNIGILSAIMFFIITFSDYLMPNIFDNINLKLKNPGLVYDIVSVFYVLVFIGFVSYFLLTLRHFFFLNQGRNIRIYFNTMLVFFILASLSGNFFQAESVSFLSSTFFIVSVLLMVFNSIRISWIAFLSKKEKIYLLLLSFVITTLFIVNINNSSGDNIHSQMLNAFSPSLKQFNVIVMVYGSIYFLILFFTTLFHLPTAEAFDRKAQEVTSLQYFSKLITEVLDFNDLAETVTDIAQKLSGSKATWIIWKNGAKQNSLAARNIGFVESDKVTNQILERISFENLTSTRTFNLKEKISEGSTSNSLSVVSVSPIKTRGETQGILVAAKGSGQIFTQDDLNAMETFSDYASVAIENSRLLEESIEKERLEKELDVAREIQRKILPLQVPRYPNLQVASVFIPAFEVGGDYYDFFKISETKLGFVIADVSGKGISAAFIMAEVKGIFESLSKTIERPKEILIKANEILKEALDNKTFVSAAYGYFDLAEKKLVFSRAGHCPLFLLRGGDSKQIKPSGLGLGLSETDYFEKTLEEYSIDLKENDTIVLYTDGVTEAKNELLEDFGDKLFLEALQSNINLTAEELSNKIIKEITVFSSGHEQYDDITLVIFKWQQ
ncbi:MAG TPA: GAF domain-containing SpoIIE family protein phosphatase [Ignavibacteriaceae bacterium]|nr:GAF domain-containing SpoIIE family protein phosphatase [Ignavibacteriaceae bacterium]